MRRTLFILFAMLASAGLARAADPAPATQNSALSTQNSGLRTQDSGLRTPDARQFWFGVAVENIPGPIARQLKLRGNQGLMIFAVMPNSPAESAGLKRYDLLVEIDGAPLTSQEDLARAANAIDPVTGLPHAARLSFLRDGDRHALDVQPAPRPGNLFAIGGNLKNFTATTSPASASASDMRNYVLPNGAAAQVGPGYRIDLSAANPALITTKTIKPIVAKGQTIILTQETDAAGAVRNTLTVGQAVYEVDAARLNAMPEELRPLAEELIANSPPASPQASGPASAPLTLEQRVKDLEEQNRLLREQVSKLIDALGTKDKALK